MMAALSTLLVLLLSTIDVTVVTLPARGGLSLTAGPAGKVELERAGTVSRVRLELDRVPPASSRGNGLNTYVVWTVSPEGLVENIGTLAIENGKGRIDATTRFEQFAVLVTAEPHYMVDRPNSAVAFQNDAPRNESIRRVTTPVETGVYDYSNIPPVSTTGVSSFVSQARTAFQLASASDAPRWAESELRQARVALDTTEELVGRAMPLDIIEASAHEAIRRAQQAMTLSRERSLRSELEQTRSEVTALTGERQQLQATVQQLTQQQTNAEAQIQRLQGEAVISSSQIQELTTARDQAAARLEQTERQLADLRQSEEALRGRVMFRVLEDFFDAKMQLTTPGRQALTRIGAVAALIPDREVRIEVPFQDPAVDSVIKDVLSKNGLSMDRIILIRR